MLHLLCYWLVWTTTSVSGGAALSYNQLAAPQGSLWENTLRVEPPKERGQASTA